jgi:hypothetical protein
MLSICPYYRIPRRLFSSGTGSGGSDVPEIYIEQPSSSDIVSGTISDRLIPVPHDTTSDSGSDQQPEEQPEEPRMIGDFDGSANEFWKLYRDEAKSHDDARISTLKEGMDSALIFVRS